MKLELYYKSEEAVAILALNHGFDANSPSTSPNII